MNVKETTSLKGIYKFTKAKLESPYQFSLNDKIGLLRDAGADFSKELAELHSICKTEVLVVENIIPTVGRTMLANNLADASPDNTILASHVALGTGTTAPANGDTTLETETYRNVVASRVNVGNVAYITGFFTASEVSGTFEEAGIFCDGSGSVDTGILFSHVLTGSITKSGSETLTVDWTLTFS